MAASASRQSMLASTKQSGLVKVIILL